MDIAGFGSIGALGIPQITAAYGDPSAAHTLVGAFSDANILDYSLIGLGRRAFQVRRARRARRAQMQAQARNPPRLFRRRRALMRVRARGVPPERKAPVVQRRVPQGVMPPRGMSQGYGPMGPAAGQASTAVAEEDLAAEDAELDTDMAAAEPAEETPWGLILGGLALVGGLVYYASKRGARKARSSAE